MYYKVLNHLKYLIHWRFYLLLQKPIENLLKRDGLISEGTLQDLENITLNHHITQALRAQHLFLKDKDWYNIFTDTILVPFKGENLSVYNTQGHQLKPKDNLLILFPSLLRHAVTPNKSDIERYCVAFNFFGFGKYGYDDVVQLGIANTT